MIDLGCGYGYSSTGATADDERDCITATVTLGDGSHWLRLACDRAYLSLLDEASAMLAGALPSEL